MKLDRSIKKIMCGGTEIKEIKYGGKTVWKMQAAGDEVIVTSITNSNHFTKNGNAYHFKLEAYKKNAAVYMCWVENGKATYLLTDFDGDGADDDSKKTLELFPNLEVRGENNKIMQFIDLDENNISLIPFKPLTNTAFAKTVVIINHSSSNYNESEEWHKVLSIFAEQKIKSSCQIDCQGTCEISYQGITCGESTPCGQGRPCGGSQSAEA